MVYQFRELFFLFDPRQRPFRVRWIHMSPPPRGHPFGATDQPAKKPDVWLVRVDLPWACFGFEVTDDGWVIEAAPIAAWTIGRRGREAVGYYRRSGRVSWQQVPHRLCYASHPLTGSVTELHAAIDQLDADTVPESYYRKVLAGWEQRSLGSCQNQ